MNATRLRECALVDISDADVMAAMKAMQGYIDITPADFREIYRVAYALARERMMSSLKAADIMTSPVHGVTVDSDLIAAASLLADKGISGAPVTDAKGCIVGIISEKDFLRQMGASKSGSFMQVVAHCLKNKGCVATPITAAVDISIGAISELLMEKNINRLPIVDAYGKLVGIVTRSDLVNAFCTLG